MSHERKILNIVIAIFRIGFSKPSTLIPRLKFIQTGWTFLLIALNLWIRWQRHRVTQRTARPAPPWSSSKRLQSRNRRSVRTPHSVWVCSTWPRTTRQPILQSISSITQESLATWTRSIQRTTQCQIRWCIPSQHQVRLHWLPVKSIVGDMRNVSS